MPLCVQCSQGHLIFFQSFRDGLHHQTVEHARDVSALAPSVELELRSLPINPDFLQGLLDFQLFIGRFSHVDDIFLVTEQRAVDQIAQEEVILIQIFKRFLVCGLHNQLVDFVPMSLLDRRLLQVGYNWQNFLQVVDLAFKLLIGRPLFQVLRQSQTLIRVSVDLFLHQLELVHLSVHPKFLLPFGNRIDDFSVQLIKFFQMFDLVISLLQFGVLEVLKSEQVFSRSIDLKGVVFNGVFVLELS